MRPMKPSYVFGWHSPVFAIWTVMMREGTGAFVQARTGGPYWPAARIVLLGLWRWLGWLLPYYGSKKTGEGFRFLGFYFNIIRGPYACGFCGRATARRRDEDEGLVYCANEVCIGKAADRLSLPAPEVAVSSLYPSE